MAANDVSQIDELIQQGLWQSARQRLSDLISANPKEIIYHLQLADIFARQHRWQDALEIIAQGIHLNPKSSQAHRQTGYYLVQLQKHHSALDALKIAAELDPSDAQIFVYAAQTLTQMQALPAALNAYQRALSINPKTSEAYCGIAELLSTQGDINQALHVLRRGLPLAANKQNLLQMMVSILAKINVEIFGPALQQDVLVCLMNGDIDCQPIAYLSAQLIVLQVIPNTQPTNLISRLAQSDLLHALLKNVINTHPELERLLIECRRDLLQELLTRGKLKQEALELAGALAQQVLLNEFVWFCSEEEATHVKMLTASLPTICSPEDQQQAFIILALYQPLDTEEAKQISTQENSHAAFYGFLQSVLRQKTPLTEPLQFTSLKEQDNNLVSQKVRQQYEDNPYPRWKAPPQPAPIPLRVLVEQAAGVQLPTDEQSYKLLVAGCGTGFEPIDIARRDPSVAISAVDLSLNSLRYAKRMADNLNITSIDFIHGDILNITNISQHFDVIISTGVLHHMQDPVAGLQALLRVLKENGVLRISLYSYFARKLVRKAHHHIQQLQLKPIAKDIRYLRGCVLASEDYTHLHMLSQSDDFYSLSGCRDLLFHEQEHHFTLAQLQNIFAELNLRICHLECPDAQTAKRFKQCYPSASSNDLDTWHEFEQRYPDTFAGMYQLWLQKC